MDPADFISIDVLDGDARRVRALPAGNQGDGVPLACEKPSKLM
jgi:hypothetical protein